MKECPYCQCVFESQSDLDAHMKEFGSNPEMHREKFRRTHGRIEHEPSDS